mmetsp:Transcript_12685/g.51203  ORF Transcript_12685/g.51203 Transcript_12685/m.51203 type:complete len:213 (+) Transcript_12685:449-1087(+)
MLQGTSVLPSYLFLCSDCSNNLSPQANQLVVLFSGVSFYFHSHSRASGIFKQFFVLLQDYDTFKLWDGFPAWSYVKSRHCNSVIYLQPSSHLCRVLHLYMYAAARNVLRSPYIQLVVLILGHDAVKREGRHVLLSLPKPEELYLLAFTRRTFPCRHEFHWFSLISNFSHFSNPPLLRSKCVHASPRIDRQTRTVSQYRLFRMEDLKLKQVFL